MTVQRAAVRVIAVSLLLGLVACTGDPVSPGFDDRAHIPAADRLEHGDDLALDQANLCPEEDRIFGDPEYWETSELQYGHSMGQGGPGTLWHCHYRNTLDGVIPFFHNHYYWDWPHSIGPVDVGRLDGAK